MNLCGFDATVWAWWWWWTPIMNEGWNQDELIVADKCICIGKGFMKSIRFYIVQTIVMES